MRFDARAKSKATTWLRIGIDSKLALRNILRHKGRTGSALAAVTFGVVVLILSQGFVEDIFVQLGEAIIHSQTGHVQISKKGYFALGMQQPEKYVIEDPENESRQIMILPQVEDVTARLNFAGLLGNGRADVAVLGEGIESEKEARLGSSLKVSAGRQLGPTDLYHALVGQGVAKGLKLQPGDRVILVANTTGGAMNTLDLEVVGLFQTFSKEYDARIIKLPLLAAQELLGTRGANTLVVSLKRTADTVPVIEALNEEAVWRKRDLRPWYEINDFYPKTVDLYRRQFGGLQLIVLLMVFLSVTNAINISVFERTAEFGTARALGNRSRDILRLVMLEGALIGLLGTGCGALLGVLLAQGISAIGIPMPPPPNADLGYIAYISVTPATVTISCLIGLLATVLASALPALRVSRLAVPEALRQAT